MYFSEKILIQKKAAGSLLKIRMNFLTIRHCFPSFLRGKIINRIHRKKFGLFSRFRKWYELEEKSILSPKLISFFTEDQLIFSISLFVITTRIYHKNPDTLAIPFGLYLQLHSFFFFSSTLRNVSYSKHMDPAESYISFIREVETAVVSLWSVP